MTSPFWYQFSVWNFYYCYVFQRNTLKEERFASGFEGFSPRLAKSIDLLVVLPRKQREIVWRHSLSNSLLLMTDFICYIPPSNSLFRFWICQWEKPLIKSEPLQSNPPWKYSYSHIYISSLLKWKVALNSIKLAT